jgi:hypothetical protein
LAAAAALGLEPAEYIARFNEHLVHYEKYLFFFIIPIFAFVLFLLSAYRRDNYYVKHLVYSVHFWSYVFVYFAVMPPVFELLNAAYGHIAGAPLFARYDGPMFVLVSLLGIVPYTWLALRNAFGENIWITSAKTFAIVFVVSYLRSWGIGLTYYVAYLMTR